jgi:hypothetical protein
MHTYTTQRDGVSNNLRFYCNNLQSSPHASSFHTLTHRFDLARMSSQKEAPHLGTTLQLIGFIHPTLNEWNPLHAVWTQTPHIQTNFLLEISKNSMKNMIQSSDARNMNFETLILELEINIKIGCERMLIIIMLLKPGQNSKIYPSWYK